MDAPATAAQPTEQMDMGALQSAPRHPHPGGPNPTSLSQRTLCRHPSKVGTVCVNRASTGLCGGYRATDIPTATAADPWGTAQARYRSIPGHRGQVHGSSAKTALPNVADFPEQPREAVGLDGLLRGAVTFRVLYVFVVLAHERRRLLHFNVTSHPSPEWAAQQMVEALPWIMCPVISCGIAMRFMGSRSGLGSGGSASAK